MGTRYLPRTILLIGLYFVLALTVPGATRAQEPDAAPPAHLATVDGNAVLEREGATDAATAGVPLVPGDRLTTTVGRVEVLFPDGSSLSLDEYTSIDLQSETLVRLISGRVLLNAAATPESIGTNRPQAIRYQIDTPVASASNAGPGEFRITMNAGDSSSRVELAVLRGTASFANDASSIFLRAGERSLSDGLTARLMPPQPFNTARLDAFDRWTDARRVARVGSLASAQYLPEDLRPYSGTLDRNGTWQYESSYGYVWYPTVATGWRPYYSGYWRSVPRYGWT